MIVVASLDPVQNNAIDGEAFFGNKVPRCNCLSKGRSVECYLERIYIYLLLTASCYNPGSPFFLLLFMRGLTPSPIMVESLKKYCMYACMLVLRFLRTRYRM